MAQFEVVVENIGTVYEGNNYVSAKITAQQYAGGKCSGRGGDAVIFEDGEYREEWVANGRGGSRRVYNP